MKQLFIVAFLCLVITRSECAEKKHNTNFVAHTANILGIFDDPFEFDGDYGQEVNIIRHHIFDLVVSKVALVKNLSDSQIESLMKNKDTNDSIKIYKKNMLAHILRYEKNYGPTLSEIATSELLNTIKNKLQTLENVPLQDFNRIVEFINKYGNEKAFHFLRNNPPALLKLDKILRDNAARAGKDFNIPILSSTTKLNGSNSDELKANLIDFLFTQKIIPLTKSEEDTKKTISVLDENYLQQFFDIQTNNKDLYVFCTPFGQIFFYWMYQALNLQLIEQHPGLIDQVNTVKEIFKNTIGNSKNRAQIFKEKLLNAKSKVIFTQESDTHFVQALLDDNLFIPVNKQNFQDGTLVFLKNDFWDPQYENIPIENYSGYDEGRLTVILATQKQTKQKFLLAACHGSSTKSEDGRMQIEKVVEKFNQLSQILNETIILLIGIDANTKTHEDVALFKELLTKHGLISTSVGPTTIKRRMVTAQHAKAGKYALDEEDYLIVKKDQFLLSDPTIGFSKNKPDINKPLPNLNNPSDHYAVGSKHNFY